MWKIDDVATFWCTEVLFFPRGSYVRAILRSVSVFSHALGSDLALAFPSFRGNAL
jgi:hypothetical protein